ncbi:MAG: biopolymer transporter ExbD [Chthoniobacterales bacterium]|jgi:biopolymer transport protein ExbD|nr:biopolymer transporter ExbD [Chthoniobacterales bacterium]
MRLERAFRLRGAVPVFTGALAVILLLVFFIMLSTSFLLRPGIAVEMPASRSLLPAMQDPIVLAVTGGAGASIYFDDRAVDAGQLGARLDGLRGASRQVVIKADKDAPLYLVARVTDLALQRGFSVALAAAPVP